MGFWNAPINLAKKAVGKATNSKIANAVPGGSAIGKSLRNAPGMKQPTPQPTPALNPATSTPIGPTPEAQQQLVNATPPPAEMPMSPVSEMPQNTGIAGGIPEMNPQMGVGPSPQLMNRAPMMRRPMRPLNGSMGRMM